MAKKPQDIGEQETKPRSVFTQVSPSLNKLPDISRTLHDDTERSSDVLEEDINSSDFVNEVEDSDISSDTEITNSSDYIAIASAGNNAAAMKCMRNGTYIKSLPFSTDFCFPSVLNSHYFQYSFYVILSDQKIVEENYIKKHHDSSRYVNLSECVTEAPPIEEHPPRSTPYPTPPYPLTNSAVGRSITRMPSAPIGFESLVPHSTGSYHSPNSSFQEDSMSQSMSSYLTEPIVAMPVPDFRRVDSKS